MGLHQQSIVDSGTDKREVGECKPLALLSGRNGKIQRVKYQMSRTQEGHLRLRGPALPGLVVTVHVQKHKAFETLPVFEVVDQPGPANRRQLLFPQTVLRKAGPGAYAIFYHPVDPLQFEVGPSSPGRIDINAHMRMLTIELRKARHQPTDGGRRMDAQCDGLRRLRYGLIRLDQQGDQLLDIRQQPLPGIRQDNTPCAAQEKRAAKVIFQLQDLPADRTLADVKDLGGLTEG